jgi:hypothetical protein
MLDPLVFGLRVFAANEYASAQRSAGPPVAGGKADCGLHDERNQQVLKLVHHRMRLAESTPNPATEPAENVAKCNK